MRAFVVVLAVVFVGSAAAQDANLAVKEGDRQLVHLTPLPSDFEQTDYFVVQLGDHAVGYGELSLKARQHAIGLTYDYRHAVVIETPNGVAMNAVVQATLTPQFSPLQVQSSRSMRTPDGKQSSSMESATIYSDRVVVTTTQDGKSTTMESARPEDPFVFAVDAMVQHLAKRLKYKQKKSFALRHLDVGSGQAAILFFDWSRSDEGDLQLNVTRDGATPDEFYVFDKDFVMTAYGKVMPPFVERRATQSQVEELRRQFGH